jgi:hypothetical protein
MNLQIPQHKGNFWTNGEAVSFSKRTLFHAISLSVHPEKGKYRSKKYGLEVEDNKGTPIQERGKRSSNMHHMVTKPRPTTCVSLSLPLALMGSVRTKENLQTSRSEPTVLPNGITPFLKRQVAFITEVFI